MSTFFDMWIAWENPSERFAVFMENGRHFGFLSACAAQDWFLGLTG